MLAECINSKEIIGYDENVRNKAKLSHLVQKRGSMETKEGRAVHGMEEVS